jgi:hypothetical protein
MVSLVWHQRQQKQRQAAAAASRHIVWRHRVIGGNINWLGGGMAAWRGEMVIISEKSSGGNMAIESGGAIRERQAAAASAEKLCENWRWQWRNKAASKASIMA